MPVDQAEVGTEFAHREHGHDQRRLVVQHERHHVAFGHAKRLQATGGLLDLALQFAGGQFGIVESEGAVHVALQVNMKT